MRFNCWLPSRVHAASSISRLENQNLLSGTRTHSCDRQSVIITTRHLCSGLQSSLCACATRSDTRRVSVSFGVLGKLKIGTCVLCRRDSRSTCGACGFWCIRASPIIAGHFSSPSVPVSFFVRLFVIPLSPRDAEGFDASITHARGHFRSCGQSN